MKAFLFIWTLHSYAIFVLDFIYHRDLYTVGWGLCTIGYSLWLISIVRKEDKLKTDN